MKKKLIPILLLAVALSDKCFAQTITDGLTVTGGPAVVGADPGGAEMLRVGGGVQINRYYSYSFAPMVNGGVTYVGGLSGDDFGFGAANLWHNHHVTLAAASTSRTFDAPARLQVWPTAVTIGSDPGGSELLRVGGSSKFSGSTTAYRFSNGGFLGTSESNARNHFIQSTVGSTTPLTGGWISGAFGDGSGDRVVIGQGEGIAIIGAHKKNLDQWADLYISGSPLNPGNGVTYVKGIAPSSVPVNTVAIGGGRIVADGLLSTKNSVTAIGSVNAGAGFSNSGFLGTNAVNARNHFVQSIAGSTTPLTGGWISAAFGDASGSRVVVGQGEGVAIIAGHTSNLDHWSDLYISGSPLNPGDGVTYIRGRAPTTVSINTVAIGGGRVMVGGTLSAKEIKVTTSGADYVFENDYKLRSLAEVEQFIAEHKHLPEMMSAKAMQADGMPVSEVVTKQLAKIEELTLYAIQAQKDRDAAQAVAKATQAQVAAQEARIQRLENLIRNLAPAAVP